MVNNVFKGLVRNYRLSSIEDVVSFINKLKPLFVIVDLLEARGKAVVTLVYEGVRLFSDEIEVNIKEIDEILKRAGYFLVATEYVHKMEPVSVYTYFRSIIRIDNDVLGEIFNNPYVKSKVEWVEA